MGFPGVQPLRRLQAAQVSGSSNFAAVAATH